MSRLSRYKESLQRFIKDRCCFFDDKQVPNKSIESILYEKIKNSDLILPILFLTIMNSQNKKNKISMQGYFSASCMEICSILMDLIDNKSMKIYGDNYNIMINYLLLVSNRCLLKNFESIRSCISYEMAYKMYIQIMEIYHDTVNFNQLFKKNSFEFDADDDKEDDDLIKWYLNKNDELKLKFLETKRLTRDSLNDYISSKVGSLTEMTICTAWILGCGDIEKIGDIKKLSKNFTMVYKLTNDFMNLDRDIENHEDGLSKNYVVNYGLQESYETFMYNKQKFIESCMMLDIFTNTIKEIINYLETKVDSIIEQTSPDIKSSCSNVISLG